MKEKNPHQTIYSIIRKYEAFDHIGDKPRPGRPKKLLHRQLSRLKRLANHKTGVSLRLLATNFGVSHQIIGNYLEEMNIKYYKKQKVSKYTDKQLEEIPPRACRLYRMLLNNDFQMVINDEKYFMLTEHSVPTNRDYHTSNKAATPSDVKFKQTRKYEPKILLWIAISTNGISSPFLAKQKQAINEKTYFKECIVKRLIPFISSHHLKEKVLFWPDLASSHHSNIVTSYLGQNDIQFGDKHFNPQNCPQARPVETLWSILKNMVYDQGWEARNIDQLKRRIMKKIKEISINVSQIMFADIRKQLRKIADHGPYHACSA